MLPRDRLIYHDGHIQVCVDGFVNNVQFESALFKLFCEYFWFTIHHVKTNERFSILCACVCGSNEQKDTFAGKIRH